MAVRNRPIRRMTSRPTNGYGRTRVGKQLGPGLGKLRGSDKQPGGIDIGVRIRGRR